MAIRALNIPTILVQRIEAAHPEPALFGVDETDDWPAEVLAALMAQGVVAEAERAEVIACPGCEWQCSKRVVVRVAGEATRAFIMCDEQPEEGRVAVSIESLKRVSSTLRSLSQFIAGALGMDPPKRSRNNAAYILGKVSGRHGTRSVIVAIEDYRAVLGVGDEREAIVQALSWSDAGLAIDTKLVRRLADRKETNTTGRQYAPDRSRQSARKAATRRRNLAIYREAKKRFDHCGEPLSRIAAVVAKMELAGGLSTESVRRIVTDQRRVERKNLRSKTNTRK